MSYVFALRKRYRKTGRTPIYIIGGRTDLIIEEHLEVFGVMDMDEREIRAVTRVSPLKKLAVDRPAMGRREMAYKLKLYERLKKNNKKAGILQEQQNISEPELNSGKDLSGPTNSEDFVADIKKRLSFDRAMVIGYEEKDGYEKDLR